MEQEQLPGKIFQLTGGALCLDFVNTVDNRLSGAPAEVLVHYGTLVSWAAQAGILSEHEAAGLRTAAIAEPGKARAALEEARAAREEIHSLFAAVARGESEPGSLASLAERSARFLGRARLERGAGGFELRFPVAGPDAGFDGLLGPVLWSALELLLHGEPARVKVCSADLCGYLFLDESKNRSRKWCSMEVCGNQAKARRYYRRTRQKS